MRVRGIHISVIAPLLCLMMSFRRDIKPDTTPYPLILTSGFPVPEIPADNQLTEARVLLGKHLFYDKILSADKTIACASCHDPARSFSDNNEKSKGINEQLGDRNAMPLVNLAWGRSFLWDGGAPTLELQVLSPLTNHKEMNITIEEAVRRLQQHADYPALFMKAYGQLPDAATLCKAIASFERSLVSCRSRFDKYYYLHDTSALNESEKRGYTLFFNDNYKMHCASCHSGANFTNESYQNNGLYSEYPDQGRYRITGRAEDKGKFKVPGLRNVGLTAPYMHDGSLKTLREVVEHYSTGGQIHPNKSSHVHVHPSLQLTEQEKNDLVNFLGALTDEEFINNPQFRQ
jgi:cytochrome c peroxidase